MRVLTPEGGCVCTCMYVGAYLGRRVYEGVYLEDDVVVGRGGCMRVWT